MKRLLKTLIIAMLVIACALSVVGCGNSDKDSTKLGLLMKKYTGESFYTVYKYTDEGDNLTSLEVKSETSVSVGRIATATFEGDNLLTTLIIPNTVVEMQEGSLKKMKRIETIVLPFIGKNANADAYMHQTAPSADKSVDAERNLGYIFGCDEYSFAADIECNYGSSTSCAYIPASLRTIMVKPADDYQLPMYAFGNINIITKVVLQAKVVAIGTHAFDNCRELQVLEITNDVKNIYDGAFNGCETLTNITFNGTKAEWESITKSTDWMEGSSLKTVTCSDGVVSLAD